MDVGQPYTAVCSALEGAVLSVLAHTTRSLTGREIARLARRSSHTGVLSVLHRLVEQGLVDQQEAGRSLLFALNRDHIAAPAVETLANMRAELLRRLRHEIDGWEVVPVNASLYGSAARGTGDVRSDIDILLIRPNGIAEDDARWRRQRDGLAHKVRRWSGNHAGLTEVEEVDLAQLRHDEPPIIAELRSDAITISGSDIHRLLDEAR